MMKTKMRNNSMIALLLPLFIVNFSLFIGCGNPLIQKIVGATKVTFESNGGSGVESQTVFKNRPVKRPSNPVKEDYVFAAWYRDNETFLYEWDFAAIPDGDMTLYAKWDILEKIPITAAAVTVTEPETDAAPSTAASGGEGKFTIGAVSWEPDDNPFLTGVEYTATVTLTAHRDYLFAADLDTATINGQPATVVNQTETTLTLVYTFPPTRTVTGMTVTAPPRKLVYTHGEALDLSGLAVQLTYDAGSPEDIALADFAGKGISTVPENGTVLSHSEHDGTDVIVSKDGFTPQNAGTLTVNAAVTKIDPTVTWPTGLTAVVGQTLADISLASYTNDPAGTFTWTTPSTSVGAAGVRSHSMKFTPTDTASYNTLTRDVTILVQEGSGEVTSPQGITFVQIPGGTFTMGSPTNEPNRSINETQHDVTLSSFRIGKYQITQKQYQAVMGSLPTNLPSSSYGVGDNYPVYYVSWYDALVFCNKLSVLEGLTPAYRIDGKTDPDEWGTVPTNNNATWNAAEIVSGSTGYRLPTEAQWEYACRAGTSGPFNFSNGSGGWGTDQITTDQANFNGTSNLYNGSPAGVYRQRTTPVGTFAANAWGLHDMHGNLFEWCWDWYGVSYYEDSTAVGPDPAGPVSGAYRVYRGGNWGNDGRNLRSAYRDYNDPGGRYGGNGFRLARPAQTAVTKTDPTVTWPTGLTALVGQTLADIQLPGNGTSVQGGVFAWTTPTASVGAAGTWTHSMTFTPTDTANYNTLTQSVTVTVSDPPTGPDIEMVWVAGGIFTMGSPDTEANRNSDETQHQVTLSGFWMGKYEVTQAQYQAVMGTNPSNFTTGADAGEIQSRRPVEMVTWCDAVEFCNKLSGLEGLDPVYTISGRSPATGYPIISATVTADWSKNGYRLPTEAQWEYACRAGTTTPWHSGTEAVLVYYAWISTNSGYKTHEVGKKLPNAWGLYDMHGNVWEWCWDRYDDYSSDDQTDPEGPSFGSLRVERGGSYSYEAEYARSAARYQGYPYNRDGGRGFRVVLPNE